MKNPIRVLMHASLAFLLSGAMVIPMAAAGEASTAAHAPLKSMNQAEYEQYRQQLDQQVKSVTSNLPKQDAAADGKAPASSAENDPEQKEAKAGDSGYGKGYRSRMGSSGSSASGSGGFRGGSMNRGGGRNR